VLRKKLIYTLMMSVDTIAMFLLLLINGQRLAAVLTLIFKYVVLLGVIQPAIFILQREPQYSHTFLAGKFLVLVAGFMVWCGVYEGFLNETDPFLGLLFLVFPVAYLILDVTNNSLMRLVYTAFGLHNDDDLFVFPENNLEVNEEAFEAYFFNYIHHPKIIEYSKYVREKHEVSGSQKKNLLVWRIMKSIIQLQKEEDLNFLRNERRQKIESHFRTLTRSNSLAVQLTVHQPKQVNSSRVFKQSDEKSKYAQSVTRSEKKYDKLRSGFYIEDGEAEVLSEGESKDENQGSRPGSDIEIKDNHVRGFLMQRLQRLRFPTKLIPRILFIAFFPWYLFFSLATPNIKMSVRLKDMFFGTLACLILLVGLVFGLFFACSTLHTYSGLGEFGVAAINSGMTIGFFLYCLKFNSHKDYLYVITVQEGVIMEFTLCLFGASVADMLGTVPVNNLTVLKGIVSFQFITVFSLLHFLLSLFCKERIHHWLVGLNVLVATAFITFFAAVPNI